MALAKIRGLTRSGNSEKRNTRRMRLPGLAVAVPAWLAAAILLAACQNVATYTEPSLIRFIDASYTAPAANVTAEGQLVAANIGSGTITNYATVPGDSSALIEITATTGGTELIATNGALFEGQQHSVFLTDDASAASGHAVAVIEDQANAAASGQSAFRFLNQATKTGAVDIYMVPSASTLADAVPLVSDLAAGSASAYVSFTSQTVTMVVTPTGATTPAYTSSAITLAGGEVRTVLIMDNQLTSNPPVQVTMADDAGPAN